MKASELILNSTESVYKKDAKVMGAVNATRIFLQSAGIRGKSGVISDKNNSVVIGANYLMNELREGNAPSYKVRKSAPKLGKVGKLLHQEDIRKRARIEAAAARRKAEAEKKAKEKKEQASKK